MMPLVENNIFALLRGLLGLGLSLPGKHRSDSSPCHCNRFVLSYELVVLYVGVC